jgi:hypothetical protein
MVRNTLRLSRSAYQCMNGCLIPKGERYLEMVMSPNHDGLGYPGWMTGKECFGCATRYGRGDLFEDQANIRDL